MQIAWSSSEAIESRGIDKCVLYTSDDMCVPWVGLESLTVTPNTEDKSFYQNGRKISRILDDELSLAISAYTYPEILNSKRNFKGLAFRSFVNETKYKIEIFYNVIISFDDVINTTFNEENELSNFSFNCDLMKTKVNGFSNTSNITIFSDSQKNPLFFNYFENMLYGSDTKDPYLPPLNNVVELFKEIDNTYSLLVVDYGDGSWLCAGSDDMVNYIDETSFKIDSMGVTILSLDTFRLQSY